MLARTFFAAPPKVSFMASLLQTPTIAELLERICTHPFNQQLLDGTLDPKIFSEYLWKDRHYLKHYALILKELSIKTNAVNPVLNQHLSYIAEDIVSGEQEMQKQYARYFEAVPGDIEIGEAISTYIDFHKKNIADPLPIIGLCSILPCCYAYKEIGTMPREISALSINPYQDWISTYSCPEFVTATEKLIEGIDQLAQDLSPELQSKIQKTIQSGFELELQFFNEVTRATCDFLMRQS